jgi:acetyl esterase/lipase
MNTNTCRSQEHLRARNHALQLVCLLILLLQGQPLALAQPAARFKSLDTNGDGKISRGEFPGGEELFSRLDANKDGFLDMVEGQKALEMLRARKGKGGAASGKQGAAGARTALPSDIEIQADIVYKTAGGESILLDLYGVKGKHYEQAPLAVFIHGGGYVGGSKQGAVTRHADIFLPLLREHGYRVASLNYRLCTPQGAKLIDCSTDCKDALRFLVKNSATYGIDPRRIATMGTSAGGSLSLLQALTKDDDLPGDPQLAAYPSRAKCAVAWFGATDFANPDLRADVGAARVQQKTPVLFKSQPGDDMHEAEVVSPVWYMKRNGLKPPMLLVHGDRDQTAPIRQSAWMDEQAKKLGVPVTFVTVKNAGHGFKEAGAPISPSRDEINTTTLNFILKNNR